MNVSSTHTKLDSPRGGLVRRLLGAEDGFALAGAIGAMVIALAFATTAALASVSAISGTVRSEDSKAALGAADAAVAAALARQNVIAGSGSSGCLQPGGGGYLAQTAPAADGWCAAVTGSIDEATYSYRTKPEPDGSLRVVATGDSDGVRRRIDVGAQSSTGTAIFGEYGMIGVDSIHMDSNSQVIAGAGSDGDIELDSNSVLCGNASVGIGNQLDLNKNAQHGGSGCPESSYTVTTAPLTLPPVQQGDVPLNNSNGRFFDEDVISGKSSKVKWNPITRELELKSNVALTLGGANYSFCELKLGSNSTLYIASGASVRIFFDTPEACLQGNGHKQLQMNSNSQISPTTTDPIDMAMLFVGSDILETEAEFSSNVHPNSACTGTFVVYGPKTDIEMNSNATFCGAIAGKSIDMDSNVTLIAPPGVDSFQLPGAGPHYLANRFVECIVEPPTSDPGSGC